MATNIYCDNTDCIHNESGGANGLCKFDCIALSMVGDESNQLSCDDYTTDD